MTSVSRTPAVLLVAVILVLAGCSGGGPKNARELLLTPEDFPGQGLTVQQRESGPDARGGDGAQITLAGDGFRVIQSVVIFASESGARQTMENARLTTANLGPEDERPSLGDESLLINPGRPSLLFREGAVLVRLTLEGARLALEGEGSRGRLLEYARVAEEKAG